jgi:hypothetical protein
MHVVGTALLIRFIFQRYIYILILKKTYLEVISEHPLLAVVSKGEYYGVFSSKLGS